MLDHALFPQSARFAFISTRLPRPDLTRYNHLAPVEQLQVAQAVVARRAEFGDSRWCAHQAMNALGTPLWQTPILRGQRGMPVFPPGITGSITHTTGYRAAVAAPTKDVASLGFDVEIAEPLPTPLLDSIALPSERGMITSMKRSGLTAADALLFSAKESTYKAWFPLTHRWLDFDGAHIDFHPDGTFVSYLLERPSPVPYIRGQWRLRAGYCVTATAISARELAVAQRFSTC